MDITFLNDYVVLVVVGICKFIFNDKNTSENRIVLNQSGYGHERCPWYFNDCYFESKYPIEIYNNKLVVNPTLVGDIKLS